MENRLDAALEKKLESIAATLKQSLTPPISGALPASSTPVTSSTTGNLAHVLGTTAPSGPTSPQPRDIPGGSRTGVPVKAKPPTPPDQAQEHPAGDQPSRNSLRSPLTRDRKSSRRSRSTHRGRETSTSITGLELPMTGTIYELRGILLHPGLPELSPMMGERETTLFFDVPIHSVKFIKMFTLRFIPRMPRTRPSSPMDPMFNILGETQILL